MELMTREMEGKLKSFPFYSQDGKGDDAIVVMKFFNPYGNLVCIGGRETGER